MLASARLMAGMIRCDQPSAVRIDSRTPSTVTVSPRPVAGSQPSHTANSRISIMPCQKLGSEAQHRRGHDAAAQRLVAVQAGDQPQRDADDTGQPDGHDHQFKGGRDALHDQFDGGDAVDEGHAQVAVQRAPQEACVLLPHGQVQPGRAIMASRAAWLASGLTSSSIGSPTAYTAKKTTTETASSTNRLCINLRKMNRAT